MAAGPVKPSDVRVEDEQQGLEVPVDPVIQQVNASVAADKRTLPTQSLIRDAGNGAVDPPSSQRTISGGLHHRRGAVKGEVGFLQRLEEQVGRKLARTHRGESEYGGGVLDNKTEDDEEDHSHGHGHGHASSTWANAVASGIINYLLMFGLCCAYGMIMFGDGSLEPHRSLGVKMNLSTAMIFGFLLAKFCSVKVAIGGPDLNPVVFLGGFIATISTDIASQLDLEAPAHRRLGGGGGGSSDEPSICVGDHLADHLVDCGRYQAEVRATSIFAVTISTLVLGLLFFISGRFKLTKYAGYVPTCVMEAFMSCVGYKVFKYALVFCNYDPKQFVPAAVIGVCLYFMKAYHIGNPAIVIPAMLLIPLGVFYAILYGSGSDLDHAGDWMFPKMDNVGFWHIWEDTIGKADSINFKAWMKTIPDLIIMCIVCFLDCLLKMMGTEGKLPVKVNKDREMQVFGLGNALTTLCGSSVGYMQLKFNVINFGILGAMDRRGGLVYSILCAATFFSSIEHFNYLPRFFLGTLLFFAGAGFVAENLWGSRKFLSIFEWCQVLCILVVFIIFQDLLYAVLTGGFLTCVDFIITCAHVPCTVGPIELIAKGAGNEQSTVRRNMIQRVTLKHYLNSTVLVSKLKGQIFFAAAQKLLDSINDRIAREAAMEIPEYRRLNFIVFDCAMVDGMDASTGKLLRKLTVDAKDRKIKILYTGASRSLEARLRQQMLLGPKDTICSHLDEALHLIESHILRHREKAQEMWNTLNPDLDQARKIFNHRLDLDPFREIFLTESARRGCPLRYATVIRAKAHETLLWEPGRLGVGVFLVRSGSVSIYRELPHKKTKHSQLPTPLGIYRSGWFVNREGFVKLPTNYYGVASEDSDILYWSPAQWSRMDRDKPRMAAALSRHMMKQQGLDIQRSDPRSMVLDRFVPEEVSAVCKRMQVVSALAKLGFFQPLPAGTKTILPPMPFALMSDLEYTFGLFTKGDGPLEQRRLSTTMLKDALMCAGLVKLEMADAKDAEVSWEQFLAHAHEAAQLRITSEQEESLKAIFNKYDSDKSGSMDQSEISSILLDAFQCDMTVEDTEALFDEWLEPGQETFSQATFVAFCARFAKLHEQEYHMRKGLVEILGEDGVACNTKEPATLTAANLVQILAKKGTQITEDEARGMLWAADWRWGKGDALALQDVVCALLFQHAQTSAKLTEEALALLVVYDDGHPHTQLDQPLHVQALDDAMLQVLSDSDSEAQVPYDRMNCRQKVHRFMDDPETSTAARVVWVFVTTMIILSVIMLILEPFLTKEADDKGYKEAKDTLFGFECFFAIVFSVEYLIRLSVASAFGRISTCKWFWQPASLCDLFAILPFYIGLAFGDFAQGSMMLRAVRLVRLTRIARVARLAKRYPLLGPCSMVMLVIWFIYMKHH